MLSALVCFVDWELVCRRRVSEAGTGVLWLPVLSGLTGILRDGVGVAGPIEMDKLFRWLGVF